MIINDFYDDNHTNSISKLFLKNFSGKNNKAVFLDRDGVLIEDVHHIDSENKVHLCDNVVPFLKKAKSSNYDIVVVTNQSAVSRSIISYEKYISITAKFLSLLPSDVYPDLILASFHMPENKNNLNNYNWRKPGIGMFEFALNFGKYDSKNVIMVGDKISDLLPAEKCKIKKLFYIQSKLHKNELSKMEEWNKIKKIKINQIHKLNEFIVD